MTLEAVIQGRTHSLAFEPLRDRSLRITLDGKSYEGHVEPLPGGAYSLIIDGRQQEVYLTEGPDGVEVELGGYRYPVTLVDPRRKASRRGTNRTGGRTVLRSSMPGKVVRTLVAEGDRVTRGAGVVVLEAMKMQNELKSPVDGVVARVHVADGEAVEANASLVEITVEA